MLDTSINCNKVVIVVVYNVLSNVKNLVGLWSSSIFSEIDNYVYVRRQIVFFFLLINFRLLSFFLTSIRIKKGVYAGGIWAQFCKKL